MEIENLRGVYKEIAIETDIETAKAIHKLFGGQQITFPKKLYNTDYVNQCIRNDCDKKISGNWHNNSAYPNGV